MNDTIKRKWANACSSIRPLYMSSEDNLGEHSTADYPATESGWASKKSRKASRFSDHVKERLLRLFLEGKETGNKYDSEVNVCR